MHEDFVGVHMSWMVEAVHTHLVHFPNSVVLVCRPQRASQYHEERKTTSELSQDLVDLLRDHVLEAQKHFEPVVVRSEETDASERKQSPAQ